MQWGDISQVQAIIEVRSSLLRADPSQGSHFFQNITSLGIPYLTVDEENGHSDVSRRDRIDWAWLEEQPHVFDGKWVRHLRLDHSLTVKCEGSESRGIILYREDLINRSCTMEEE